jgi:hypothetical protein
MIFFVPNLVTIGSRWPRVVVLGLIVVGVVIMPLVRRAMLAVGASAIEAIVAVFVAIVLYSLWVNLVLAKKIGRNARAAEGVRQTTRPDAAHRTKLRILGRLLFQALLFCLGSWLLITGSPNLGADVAKLPVLARFLIVACALCLMVWRVFHARRRLMRLNNQPDERSQEHEGRITVSVESPSIRK